MITLTRGQKVPLANSLTNLRVRFAVQTSGLTLDYSCFGLDAKGQLSDDRYFVFYNQKQSPERAITMLGNTDFDLDLARIPSTIHKLVFVVTVDGIGGLQQLERGVFSLSSPEGEMARFEFKGAQFEREKAVMMAEIYRRDGWRLAAVGQGFAGGLDAVLTHFGGQLEETSTDPLPIMPPQTDTGLHHSIACVRCGKKAISWAELRDFNSETGRCTNCSTEVQTALENLRREFLLASKSGILQDAEWQAMWKRFDGEQQKIGHEEALTFLRPDTLQFVERLLTMAGADGVITPASEKYIKQMLDAFGIPTDLQRPLKSRLQKFKALGRIRSGHLPVIKNDSHLLNSNEICHLSVPATYRKATTRSVSDVEGMLLATSKRVFFTPSNENVGGRLFTVSYRNIFQIKEATDSVFLGISSGNGNGRYFVKDIGHVEAVITTLILMSKRLLLGPQAGVSRHIPQDVRSAVWQRDGGKCVECGAKEYLELDHIIPHSEGGANTVNNVQLLCRKCNLAKGARI